MNSLRMICRTFIDWLAQSIRFFPRSAKSRFLMSQFSCGAVVDIPLLWRLRNDENSVQITVEHLQPLRIHEPGEIEGARMAPVPLSEDLKSYSRTIPTCSRHEPLAPANPRR